MDLNKLPPILRGNFFIDILKNDSKGVENKQNITARCNFCKTKISGSVKSTGNFRTHLKRKHPEQLNILDEQSKKLKVGTTKQTSLDIMITKTYKNKKEKEKVLSLIMDYIIDEMRPLSTIEKPAFVNLIKGLSNVTPPCRETLKNKLMAKKCTLIQKMKDEFKKIEFFCTTADLWSCRNKSYLGVTGHYIERDTLTRRSVVLSCQRMKYSHTFQEIAKGISKVHSYFGISKQVVGSVTDNAANFSKAFKVYNIPESASEHSDFLEDDDVEIEVVELPDFNNINDDSDDDIMMDEITLPAHFRCFSHSLNLVASKDVDNALKNSTYKKIYNSAVSKLTALWNISHQSTKAADSINDICGCKLVTPCPTRWNSFYDSLQRIIFINEKDKLDAICESVGKPKLKSVELEFIKEYVNTMKPIAKAIDLLQGEQNCFLGLVIPVIKQIKESLNNLTSFIYCEPLKEAIIDGINKRFGYILNWNNDQSKSYILATVSHPKFKLKWLDDEGDIQAIKSILINECKKYISIEVPKNVDTSDEDDFFNFAKSQKDANKEAQDIEPKTVTDFSSMAEVEVLRFIQDKSSLQIRLVLQWRDYLVLADKF